jgi:hypothetical protein
VASAAILTSYTYFFVDDFIFLRQAQTVPFGLTYLRLPLFEHFSPISRFLDKVLVTVAPGSFAFAHAMQLALYGTTLVVVALLLSEILGNSWRAFLLTIAFGQSLFLMRLLNWWTATANILPSTAFTALALLGYLRWRRSHSWWWFVVACGGFVGAALDYETGLLVPLYVGAVLFVVQDDLQPRVLLRTLWRERLIWGAFAAIGALALANYFSKYYFSEPHPSSGRLLHFLEISLFEAFIPALGGIADSVSTLGQQSAVAVVAALIAAGAVGLALYLRPRVWRCVAAFVLIFLVTMVPLGLNRVQLFGLEIGHELYYQQSLQLMFFVLLAFAIKPSFGPARTSPTPIAALARSLLARPWRAAVVAGAGIAAYAALYVTSVDGLANSSWQPRRAHSFIAAFHASVARVVLRTGHEPVLIDHTLPPDVVPAMFTPFDHYDEFLPVVGARVQFDRAAGPVYVLDEYGRLRPVRFQPVARGLLGAGACAPAAGAPTAVRVPLQRAVAVPQSDPTPSALRVTVQMTAGAQVNVAFEKGSRLIPDDAYPHIFPPGRGEYFVPLTLATTVDVVELALPPGSCITRLALGSFAPAGAPA